MGITHLSRALARCALDVLGAGLGSLALAAPAHLVVLYRYALAAAQGGVEERQADLQHLARWEHTHSMKTGSEYIKVQ